MSFIVAPSILSCDFSELKKEVQLVEAAGADWIHIDVMDGQFVPSITIGPAVVKSLRPATKLPFDVHLMIENPEKHIEQFAKAGADYITIHIEATKNPAEAIKLIKSFNVKAGLTLKPKTDVKTLFPFLKDLDLVLVMTVEPGKGGQHFMQDQVLKIKELRREIDRQNIKAPILEVDGGVNLESVKHLSEVDALVAGSYIFKAQDYKKAISDLKALK